MDLRRCAAIGTLLFCLMNPALAATFVVDDDRAECPNADFASIQSAVAAADPGDKILVCPGIYHGTVEIVDSDLRIEAQGALGEVVLQGTAAEEWGFHMRRTSGVVLEGFWVQGFAHANIFIDEGSGNTLRRNVTTAGVIDGIRVEASTGNVLEHNVSFANTGPALNSDGIFLTRSSGNFVRHNEAYENAQAGINVFEASSDNVVSGNRVHHNRIRGISNGASNRNVIENNHAFANGLVPPSPLPAGFGIGILVANSAEVTVSSNRSEGNGGNGIALNNSVSSIVATNRSEGNRTNGIVLNNLANNNVVTNNRSQGNALTGILLMGGSSGNRVEKNEVFSNAEDGIRLFNNSDGNAVQGNHVRRSGRDGISIADTASGANTIERNGMAESGRFDANDASVANAWDDNHCETENRPGLCKR